MSAVAMGYCWRACTMNVRMQCGRVLIQRDSLGTSAELPPYGRATIRTHATAALKDSASSKIFSTPKPGPEETKKVIAVIIWRVPRMRHIVRLARYAAVFACEVTQMQACTRYLDTLAAQSDQKHSLAYVCCRYAATLYSISVSHSVFHSLCLIPCMCSCVLCVRVCVRAVCARVSACVCLHLALAP